MLGEFLSHVVRKGGEPFEIQVAPMPCQRGRRRRRQGLETVEIEQAFVVAERSGDGIGQ